MTDEKPNIDCFCVGGGTGSCTVSIGGEKCKSGQNLPDGKFVRCDRKKSMSNKNNTMQAGGLGKAFKNFGIASAKAGKK